MFLQSVLSVPLVLYQCIPFFNLISVGALPLSYFLKKGETWFFKRKWIPSLCRLFTRLYIGYVHRLSHKSQHHRIWLRQHLNDWCGWPNTFLPRHMDGNLVYGLSVTIVPKFFKSLCKSACILAMVLILSRCNVLKLIKLPLLKNRCMYACWCVIFVTP